MPEFQPYEISFNHKPNFRVRYRLFPVTKVEGIIPHPKHYRCDFHYKNDGNFKHSLYMIWPELEDENEVLDGAEYARMSGTARCGLLAGISFLTIMSIWRLERSDIFKRVAGKSENVRLLS